jgi:hypothetical protein
MNMSRKPILLVALLMYLTPGHGNASPTAVPDNLSDHSLLSQPRDHRFNHLAAQEMQDSTKRQTPPSLKLKNPYMAAFYSVIPGVALHGAGHVYAGKIPTAITLFGCELLGVGLGFLGGVSQIGGSSDAGENAAFVGFVLFAGSWLYDVIVSPVAVQKQNRKLLEKNPATLEFRIRSGEPRLAFVWRF